MSASRADTPRERASFEQARSVAAGIAAFLLPERVALDGCVGRQLAEDLITGIAIPHYDSAAMDGWVVAGPGPWRLTRADPQPGQARIIVTGGAVPSGANAVLRSESGTVRDGVLRSLVPGEPSPGQHIRPAGTEATGGETLLQRGDLLNPASVALAASAGVDELLVHAIPEVALVFTGDEVVTRGVPQPGRVRDSFGVQFPALFTMLGARVTGTRRIGDDLSATVAALAESAAMLTVTSGGTGAAATDHLRPALRELAAEVLIDGIAMRPGGPTTVARLPDGRIVMALPGNPLAAMVAAISVGGPLIAGISGRSPRPFSTMVAATADGRAGTTTVVPFFVREGRATPTAWRGSGMMRGLAAADALMIIPAGGLVEGEHAEILPLPWRTAVPGEFPAIRRGHL